MLADLHSHSLFSDGERNVEDLIDIAKEKGLFAYSITDHDSILGQKIALDYSKKKGINYITGIEISSNYNGVVHILGYGVDINNKEFKDSLKAVVEKRINRNKEILKKLEEKNIYIPYSELEQVGSNKIVGRKFIAEKMIEKGYVENIPQAFNLYIGAGKSCYVPFEKMPPEEAIRIIHLGKGLAFLAHPCQIYFDNAVKREFVKGLKDKGLDGIEAYYCTHLKEEVSFYEGIARENNLLISGGSDYHGEFRPSRIGDVSKEIPEETVELLLEKTRINNNL